MRCKDLAALAILGVGAGSGLAGQSPPRDTTVVPHAEFQADGFRLFLLGKNFRALWTTPIRVPEADLKRIGGGLRAVEREGDEGRVRNRPFVFKAEDGRIFGFRELVKDATREWPERLRTNTLRKLAQDQISGTVPAGALIVVQIDRAAGVYDPGAELVVLPDDPRLGEWRSEYAHRIGTIEPRLRDSELWVRSVPGAKELVSSDSLFVRLRSEPASRVDARAFLTARLVDLLVGDWDRHGHQWTWARFDDRQGGGHRWVPIPTDRDWAFNHLEGPVEGLFRKAQPMFQKFDPEIRSWSGLLIQSQPLDRRLLTSLDARTWDSVTAAVVTRVSDPVIASAVATLPDELDGPEVQWLTETLKQRRDRLPAISKAFYLRLADVVEVWATDSADRIRLEPGPAGEVNVTVERGREARLRWSRQFVPGETREVRVYALRGNDVVSGSVQGSPIRVRLIHDGSEGLSGGDGGAVGRGDGLRVSTTSFRSPHKEFDPDGMFRDWGSSMGFTPWINSRAGIGFLLGGGPVFTRYGFRRVPYASRIMVRAGYTTGTSAVNADLQGDFRFRQPGLALMIRARAMPGDALHYFGIGNETERPQQPGFYILHEQSYRVEPRLVLGAGSRTEFSVGGTLRVMSSDTDRPTLAGAEQPYGFGTFTLIGAIAGVELDARDDPGYPVRGVRAALNGRFFPGWGDAASSFGVAEGVVSGFLGTRSLPATPVLAVRVGGAKGFGEIPFFEAPTIGGYSSMRGYSSRRFLGDDALYGSAELRFNFGGFKVVVPGEWGMYGLADMGRVYRDGEESSVWHKAVGGGLWLGFVDRRGAVSLTFAKGSDGGRFHLAMGYHF